MLSKNEGNEFTSSILDLLRMTFKYGNFQSFMISRIVAHGSLEIWITASCCKTMDHLSDLQSIVLLVTDVYHKRLDKYCSLVDRERRTNYLINLYSS